MHQQQPSMGRHRPSARTIMTSSSSSFLSSSSLLLTTLTLLFLLLIANVQLTSAIEFAVQTPAAGQQQKKQQADTPDTDAATPPPLTKQQQQHQQASDELAAATSARTAQELLDAKADVLARVAEEEARAAEGDVLKKPKVMKKTPSSSEEPVTDSSSSPSSPTLMTAAAKRAEDARELKYVVGLLKKALPPRSGLPSASSGSKSIVMTSKKGMKFRCTIPDESSSHTREEEDEEEENDASVSEVETAAAASATTTVTSPAAAVPAPKSKSSASSPSSSTPSTASNDATIGSEESLASQHATDEKAVMKLLRTHLSSGCFTHQREYWTYEVCPFSRVRQYHASSTDVKKASGLEFKLGSYVALGDAFVHGPAKTVSPIASKRSAAGSLIYTQRFEGGTDNRQSRVTFTCNTSPDASSKANSNHLLVGISEPKPFHYEFEIKTTLLCRDEKSGLMLGKGSGITSTVSEKETKGTSAASKAGANAQPEDGVETGRLNTGQKHYTSGASSSSSPSKSSTSSSTSTKSIKSPPHILDYLESLGNTCLYLNTGWWTYKLCYLKEITQFHREQVVVPGSPTTTTAAGSVAPQVKTGATSAAEAAANLAAAAAQVAGGGSIQTVQGVLKMITTAEFILGMLPASTTQAEIVADTTLVVGTSPDTTYISQHYHSGTMCDLNNRPRQVETRIYCDINESTSQLKSITESSTCEYIAIVHTPLICKHKSFAPEVPKIVEITCEPMEKEEKTKKDVVKDVSKEETDTKEA